MLRVTNLTSHEPKKRPSWREIHHGREGVCSLFHHGRWVPAPTSLQTPLPFALALFIAAILFISGREARFKLMAWWSTLGPQWTCLLRICMLVLNFGGGIKLAVAQNHRGVELYNTSNMTIQGRKKYHVLTSSWGAHKTVTPSGWDYHILVSQCPICFQTGVRKDTYHILLGTLPNVLVRFPQKLP